MAKLRSWQGPHRGIRKHLLGVYSTNTDYATIHSTKGQRETLCILYPEAHRADVIELVWGTNPDALSLCSCIHQILKQMHNAALHCMVWESRW